MKFAWTIFALALLLAVGLPAFAGVPDGYSEKTDNWYAADPSSNGMLRLEVEPSARRLGRYAKVWRTEDGVAFDLREAFRQGASLVRIYLPTYDKERVSGHETFFDTEWTFPRGVQGRLVIRGERNRVNWWMPSQGGYAFSLHFPPLRKHYRRAHEIPAFVEKPCQRVDLISAGDGPIILHSHRACPATEATEFLTMPPCPKAELLHAETFDDGRLPGLEYAEGRKGLALRFTKTHPKPFVLPVKGNLDPTRGTMDFWVKREWRNPRHFSAPTNLEHVPRYIFDLPAGDGKPGSGAMNMMWDDNYFFFRRGDTESTEIKGHKLAYSGAWRHYTVVWDDYRTRVYCNGVRMPYGSIPDYYQPLAEARRVPRQLDFLRTASDFTNVYFGNDAKGDAPFEGCIDELRIWSEPMEERDVRRLFLEANGGPMPDYNGWDEPFDPMANPPPATNRLVRAPATVGGVPADLELVERIRLDDLALLARTNRFRSVGHATVRSLGDVRYLEVSSSEKEVVPRLAVRLKLVPEMPFHVLEIDYPDDRARTMEILVQRCRREKGQFLYSNILESGVMTGDEYPLSGGMRTVRLVYWAEDADSAVIFRAIGGTPLAVAEVRVYRPKTAALPAAMDDTLDGWDARRHFALYFEDMPLARHFGVNFCAPGQVQEHLDRQIAYMRFCGQDMLVYPGVFYQGLVCNRYVPRFHPDHYLKEIARRFDREGLGLMPSMHRLSFPDEEGAITRKALADGTIHATPLSINDTGRPNPCTSHAEGPVYSVFHPETQRRIRENLRDLLAELGGHPSFRGVCLNLNYRDSLWWGGLGSGYNDHCIEAFEKTTGIVVPVDRKDLDRGAKYAAWLKANARDAWVDWRCDVLTEFYRRLDADMKSCRRDLRLWIMVEPNVWGYANGLEGWERPDAVTRLLREGGIDGRKIAAAIPDAILGNIWRTNAWRDEVKSAAGPAAAREKMREIVGTADYGAETQRGPCPALTLWDAYYESAVGNRSGANRLSGDWLDETKWRVSVVSPCGREALRDFALALRHGDVLDFAKGGFVIGTYGTEDVLVPWMRAFRSLPAVRFEDLPAPAADVVFRGTTHKGVVWRYLCNVSSRPRMVTLPANEGGEKVSLDAYELKVWKAERPVF